MSRGFVKEDDLELAGTDLPERTISEHPNYVTPYGLSQLQHAFETLEQERLALVAQKDNPVAAQRIGVIERELRYFAARLESAILVDPATHDRSVALFGAHVKVEDETGAIQSFVIVGEDEADANEHKVSYRSPIANALIGKKVGDSVLWLRPAGNLTLEIIEILY